MCEQPLRCRRQFCGHPILRHETIRAQECGCVKVEVAVLGSPVPNSPYGLCGRKATVELERDNIRMHSGWQLTAAAHREVQT